MKQIVFQLFLFTLLVFSCDKSAPEELPEDLFNTKVERVEEVEILYSDSAQIKVRITGDVMLNHLDKARPRQEFTGGVLVDFFDENENISSQLVAKYAIRYEKEGKVICRDSVVWQSLQGQKLETEELIWEEKKEQVYTRKFAQITTNEEIIRGHGFTAKQDFSNARIQQVEGIIAIDDLE